MRQRRDRGKVAAGAPARARLPLPPTPEVCSGTDSRPRSPWPPSSVRGPRVATEPRGWLICGGGAHPEISQAGRGEGASGPEGTPSPGASSGLQLDLGPRKGPSLPGDPFALCKELPFPGPLPGPPSRVPLLSAVSGRPHPRRDRVRQVWPTSPGTSMAGPGLAASLGLHGSELCSTRLARGAGRRATSIGLRAEPASPWTPRFGVEGPGLECVIGEQAPRQAGRVSKSAPLLCPSQALPPPLSLRHPLPQPPWPLIPAAVA